MPALATPYKRKPIYQFPDLNTTGLEEIPENRILFAESNQATFVKIALDPADLTIQNGLDSGNVIPTRLYDPDTGLTLDPGDLVKISGDTMTGELHLPNPTTSTSAVNLGFADDRYVNVTGDTMTGDLTVPGLIANNATMTTATVTTRAQNDTDVVNAESYASETLGGTVKMRVDLTDPTKPKLYMATDGSNP